MRSPDHCWKYVSFSLFGLVFVLSSVLALQLSTIRSLDSSPSRPRHISIQSVSSLSGTVTGPHAVKRVALETDVAASAPALAAAEVVPEGECGADAYALFQKDNQFPLEKLCAPHPWLLPARAPAFPYSGIIDEEELLALRSSPYKQHEKTISVFVFTRAMALLSQNYVYTLVRFTGVTNYLAVTGSPDDHEACLDLNLPCWDASRFSDSKAEEGTKRRYNDITWLRPRVVAHLIENGYVVHLSDVDVAYSTKPLWESYMRYIGDVGVDGAMGWELGKMLVFKPAGMDVTPNTGNYVILPTPQAKAFTRQWADVANRFANLNDQRGLNKLRSVTGGRSHTFCWHPGQCAAARAGSNATAVFRLYQMGWMTHFPEFCLPRAPINKFGIFLDPCHWTMLYYHSLCKSAAGGKVNSLKDAGFWFIDDSGAKEGELARPAPMRLREPHYEDAFLQCREHELAFTYIPYRSRGAAVAVGHS